MFAGTARCWTSRAAVPPRRSYHEPRRSPIYRCCSPVRSTLPVLVLCPFTRMCARNFFNSVPYVFRSVLINLRSHMLSIAITLGSTRVHLVSIANFTLETCRPPATCLIRCQYRVCFWKSFRTLKQWNEGSYGLIFYMLYKSDFFICKISQTLRDSCHFIMQTYFQKQVQRFDLIRHKKNLVVYYNFMRRSMINARISLCEFILDKYI